MSLGLRLKEKRKEKKLTQKDIAKIFGIDHTTVSKWESDIYEPDTTTLNKLADYFEVSVDYLLGRTQIDNGTKKTDPLLNEAALIGKKYGLDDLEKMEKILKVYKNAGLTMDSEEDMDLFEDFLAYYIATKKSRLERKK